MSAGELDMGPRLNRRQFVGSAAAAALVAASPLNASDLSRDPRLVVILPRGAPDGGAGWLNRAAGALRDMGRARSGNLIAIGSRAPSILQGATPALICAPGALHCIAPDRLGEHLDERGALRRPVVIAAPLVAGLVTLPVSFPTAAGGAGIQESALDGPWIPARAPRVGNDIELKSAAALGRALAAPQGMRIGVIESGAPYSIAEHDQIVAALAREMASVWNETIVIAAGRATGVPLAGGAAEPYRLEEAQGRISGLKAICAAVLHGHLGIPADVLAGKVAEAGIGTVDELLI